MILDQNLMFFDAVALTATTTSKVLDCLAPVMLGAGNRLRAFVAFDGVAPGGTSPTASFALNGADDAAMSVNVIPIGAVTPVLTAGTQVQDVWEIGISQRAPKRYYAVVATLGGTSPTMTVSSGMTEDLQSAPNLVGA